MKTLAKTDRLALTPTIRPMAEQQIWSPPTDLFETEKAHVIRVEIGGMREDEFEIGIENNALIISGTRRDAAERGAYHQMQVCFGKFMTTVGLPRDVDIERCETLYQDGILTVTLPKSRLPGTRTITTPPPVKKEKETKRKKRNK